MRPVGIIVVVGAAAACGYWAWRQTTRNMYYRSPQSTIRPPEVSQEDYDAWVLARRKRWRAAKSVLFAGLGAIIVGILVTMIDSGLARR
jgi:hypothetical protein